MKRNRDSSGFDMRRSVSAAPVPVRRKKPGAQMWVIQRVKKSAAVVVAGSVGLTAALPK